MERGVGVSKTYLSSHVGRFEKRILSLEAIEKGGVGMEIGDELFGCRIEEVGEQGKTGLFTGTSKLKGVENRRGLRCGRRNQ